jgi:preprotein translocase subunit SecG
MLYPIFSVLIIITCILLILIVLVQNSKGGGLASNFSAGNQFGGVVQTNKFLEKATWSLAVALLVLCLAASISVPKSNAQARESAIKEQVNRAVDYKNVPVIPSKQQTEQQNNNKQPVKNK